MVGFWRLSNGGATAPTGCRWFGSVVQAMTISPPLRFVGSRTLVVCIVWWWRAWCRCRTYCGMSKLFCSISDHNVDSPESSVSSLLISQSGLSSSWLIRLIARTLSISNTIFESWVGSSNIWSAMKIGCLLQCTCKGSLKVCFLILLWIVIPHLAGHRFHVW